ncbi:MAG: hypothetical protein BGP24_10570 [Lysobacterales bacterium 69-70]|nr:histidine kinase [Xanthomonadaceae bacterium]ODV18048.1 MAG: hypothetical protein ABT27_15560 [Xanthomonadaceae bacterium SCN 69-25]OJZ00918.1 MAG: hypothetical protein BGP24_10570 [Xanthomonadales bacterium 69-70]
MIAASSSTAPGRYGLLLCALLAAMPAPAAEAEAPDDPLAAPQYQHSAWSLQDGAPPDIWALAQRSDGYLWLGTGNGLFRFDGISFERYAPPPSQRLANSNVTALYTAADDALWMGFLPGGISVLRDGRWQHYDAAAGAPATMTTGFAEDRSGALWAAATRDGLRRFDGTRWQPVGADWDFPGHRADAVLTAADGTLWVATDTTLVYLPPGEHRFRSTGVALGGGHASLAQAPDGRLWLSDKKLGTRAFAGAADAVAATQESAVPPIHFAQMRFDRYGVFWGTDRNNHGVRRSSRLADIANGQGLRDRDFDASTDEHNGLSSNKTVPLLSDREGNVWAGTNLGLHRFRYNNVRMLRDARLDDQLGYAIGASERYGLLIANRASVYALHDGPLQRLFTAPVDNIAGLATGRDDTIWFTSTPGLWRWQDGRLASLPSPDGTGSASLIAGDGADGLYALWQPGGLQHHADGRWQPAAPALAPQSPSVLLRGADDALWLGYADSRLLRWRDGEQQVYTEADGMPAGTITALAPLDGALLVAGENGVALLQGERARPVATEPPELLNGVSGIVVAADGAVWFNGLHGIVQALPAALRAAAATGRPAAVRVFDKEDGLHGVALQFPASPSAVRDAAGRLWFATNQGIARIAPAQLYSNAAAPPVAIRALRAGGYDYAVRDGLALLPGTRDLQIDYTALSLAVPRRVQLRYRLSGVDADWQDAGTRRRAFYANLGPGAYRFDVIAANDSGVWNRTGATLDFRIEPRFVETWIFYTLCALAAAATLFALYLLRLRQLAARLRARLDERHRERERIARELHDTLLQGVQGLILRFQAIANKVPRTEPLRDALETTLDRAEALVVQARDRVQDLRAGLGADAPSLPEALARTGAELAEAYPAEFRVVVEGRLPVLDSLRRDEIFRIGREALYNAFRHARARHIEVEIVAERERLRLRVRDDGQGIAEDILDAGGKAGHWGLSGMRERALALGAQLNIWSRRGSGSEIELLLPLPDHSRWQRLVRLLSAGNP